MNFGNQETGPADQEERSVLEAAFPGWEARFHECDPKDALGDLAMNGADPFYLEKLLLKWLHVKLAGGVPVDSPMEAAPGVPSPQSPSPAQSDQPSARAETAPVVGSSPAPGCEKEAYLLTLMHEYLIRTYKGTADIWERIASMATAALRAVPCDGSAATPEDIQQKILCFRRTCAREMFAIDDEVEAQILSSDSQSGISSESVMSYFVMRSFNRPRQARFQKAG